MIVLKSVLKSDIVLYQYLMCVIFFTINHINLRIDKNMYEFNRLRATKQIAHLIKFLIHTITNRIIRILEWKFYLNSVRYSVNQEFYEVSNLLCSS